MRRHLVAAVTLGISLVHGGCSSDQKPGQAATSAPKKGDDDDSGSEAPKKKKKKTEKDSGDSTPDGSASSGSSGDTDVPPASVGSGSTVSVPVAPPIPVTPPATDPAPPAPTGPTSVLKPISAGMIAIGLSEGGGPIGVGRDSFNVGNKFSYSFMREDTDRTGVRVAVGDWDGDGTLEWAVGAGDGGAPRISTRRRDGTGSVINDWFAFEQSFRGGVFLAACDVNKDGKDDLVVGAGAGGGPRVAVFSAGDPNQRLFDFMALDVDARLGAVVACGDVDGDGFGDIIVSFAKGGGPRVRVFSLQNGPHVIRDFMADGIEVGFRGGLWVAAGDMNGDGYSDIIVGAGDGGGPRVQVYSGKDNAKLWDFFAYEPTLRSGVRVAAFSKSASATAASLLTIPGDGGSMRVRAFDLNNPNSFGDFIEDPSTWNHGGYIGGRPRL